MFGNLKTRTERQSNFQNMPSGNARNYHRSPGTNSSVIKGNEADRMVRCRHCGFPCDTERDVNLPDGSYAGFGITLGAQLTMGATVGDSSSGPQTYYDRDVRAGCPCCGSFTYHPRQRITQIP